jgi:hypothetical protein
MSQNLPARLRPILAAVIGAVALAASGLSMTAGADGAAPHVIVISIDGMKPETYTERGLAQVPTLQRLAARGVFASGVVGVLPTLTFPSHTTLITGVPPAVHGIYNNRILDPENRSYGAWYWYARDIKVPTLTGALRARGLTTAAVSWPASVGFDIDFLVPEFSPQSLAELRPLSRPATLLDEVEAAREHALPWPLTDAARAEIAAWIFRAHRPNLMLLHLVDTDTAQHYYGPRSREALASMAAADRHVATVLDAVHAAGLRARTDIVIVSDHGFIPAGQRLELNTLFKREGWLQVDEQGRVTQWEVYFQASGGSGFVFLKNTDDVKTRNRVRTILDAVASDPANGVERVLSTEDLRALGADPRASFAVDMRSGFYAGGGSSALIVQATGRGGHGNDPSRPDLHASLIMAGPLVPRSGDLGIVRMTQIAPTIAAWFGVGLSPKADEPLALTPAAAATSAGAKKRGSQMAPEKEKE